MYYSVPKLIFLLLNINLVRVKWGKFVNCYDFKKITPKIILWKVMKKIFCNMMLKKLLTIRKKLSFINNGK